VNTLPQDQPLKVGSPVSICPQKPECEFPGVITDISPETIRVELLEPTLPLPFKSGDGALVLYWQKDELYYFGPKVLEASGPNLVLSAPDSTMDVQRRTSYRLSASVPLSYTVVNATKSELTGRIITESRTEDISSGGLKFETDLPLELGDTLVVSLDLSPAPKMTLHGWVVWTEKIEKEGQLRFLIGLAFLQMEPEEQIRLLQFMTRFQTSDRRIFPRWVTSMPCIVRWKDYDRDYDIEGKISNLSFGGALITDISALPPENAPVELTFQTEEKVTLNSVVTVRVVHSQADIAESGGIGWFGVAFEQSAEELRSQLAPILRNMFSQQVTSD